MAGNVAGDRSAARPEGTAPTPVSPRGVPWRRRVLRRLVRHLTVLVLVFLATYGVFLYRFVSATPRVTRNFSAEFNSKVLATPEAERAWPIYREAYGRLERLGGSGIDPREELDRRIADVRPGHTLWPEAVAYVERNAAAIELIRRAAARPALGWVLSKEGDAAFTAMNPGSAPAVQTAGPSPDPNPPALDWDLGYLGTMRRFERVMRIDLLAAAEAGDAVRAHADMAALVGLAAHCREHPILIADLVSAAIVALTTDTINDVLATRPGLLTDAQLADLASRLSAFAGSRIEPRLEGERVMFADTIQRVYTDDGHGDGRLTADGLRNMDALMHGGRGRLGVRAFIFGPFDAARGPGRKAVTAEYERLMALGEKDLAAPTWEREWASEEEVSRINVPSANGLVALPTLFMPDLRRAANAMDNASQRRDATLVAIALERFRLAHGEYPRSLTELVPEYLAAVPIDRHDGQRMRYVWREGRPWLYSAGSDADDDGGVPPAAGVTEHHVAAFRGPGRRAMAPDGDWVLWPPLRREEETEAQPEAEPAGPPSGPTP